MSRKNVLLRRTNTFYLKSVINLNIFGGAFVVPGAVGVGTEPLVKVVALTSISICSRIPKKGEKPSHSDRNKSQVNYKCRDKASFKILWGSEYRTSLEFKY